MPTLSLVRGLNRFLQDTLGPMVTELNTDLAALVVSAQSPPAPAPQFALVIGKIPSVRQPRLWFSQTYVGRGTRVAVNEKVIPVAFKIGCLVPSAGDNTSSNFEMALETAADHLLNLFLDDTKVLTPRIDAGVGVTSATGAELGDIVDTWPLLLQDGVTVSHGWETVFTANFSVQTR